ncbi:hypothetical protein, partial [Stenotrophomonas sp. A3_2]|uniref:hypothetical protein n=1 Tax=Stenotrophomonas sp. A3_2 TaxID=3119978 RepID=UPI002FC369B7
RLLIAVPLLALAPASGRAAVTIPAGNYIATTLSKKIANDTTGTCAQLVPAGSVQRGVGAITGLGQPFQTVTPRPSGSAGSYSLGAQVCNYPALPATLNANGKTPTSGSTTCSLNGVSYSLTTNTG